MRRLSFLVVEIDFIGRLEPTKATIILSDIRLPLVWANIKAKSRRDLFFNELIYLFYE
jgi:hypothetical protein